MFLVFINSLLLELHNSGFGGVNVGENLKLNSLGYADDLALFAEDPAGLQKLIEICENWSKNNCLEFAPTKSKIVVFHPSKCSKKQRKFRFSLNGVSLKKVKSFEYLGIDLEESGNICGPGRVYQKHFAAQIDKAEKRLGAVSLLGFHKEGLKINTAVKLYKLLVRPMLEFGAQILPYNDSQIDEMEKFQCKSLRTLLGLFPSVKAETVRLLAGVEPMVCRLSILKTNYFHRLRTSQKTAPKALLSHVVSDRKLARCFLQANSKPTAEWVNVSKNSFAGLIELILARYGLINDLHCRDEQTRRDFSKKLNSVCKKFYFEKDVAAFCNTRQGKLFKEVCLPDLVIRKPYSGCAINPLVFKNSTRETGSHFASEIFCAAFKKERSNKSCPFCSSSTRTLNHYTLECPYFDKERLDFLKSIPLPINAKLNLRSLFGTKHLGDSSELSANPCGMRAGTHLIHTAEYLHSIRLVFEKFAKS